MQRGQEQASAGGRVVDTTAVRRNEGVELEDSRYECERLRQKEDTVVVALPAKVRRLSRFLHSRQIRETICNRKSNRLSA